jgi:hypothetical protein
MAAKVRVTSRTDSRGTVNGEYRGLYELQSLKAAADAGIPGHMLHPAGWDGNEDDLTGYFAEQVYRLADAGFTAPDAISRLAEAIEAMQQVCRNFRVDPKAAVPYDMARFKRQLFESREHRAETIVHGDELPLGDPEAFAWGQW